MPFVLPIRRRRSKKIKLPIDPHVRLKSRAVVAMALGLLIIITGIALSVFGASTNNENGKSSKQMIIGAGVLLCGFVIGICGTIAYVVILKQKQRMLICTQCNESSGKTNPIDDNHDHCVIKEDTEECEVNEIP